MQHPNHQRGSQRAQLALQACFNKKNPVYGSTADSTVPKKATFAFPIVRNNHEDLALELERFNDENSNSNSGLAKVMSSTVNKSSNSLVNGGQTSLFSLVADKPANTSTQRPSSSLSGTSSSTTANGEHVSSSMAPLPSVPSFSQPSNASMKVYGTTGINSSQQQSSRPGQPTARGQGSILTQNSMLSQPRNSPSRIQNFFQQCIQAVSAISSTAPATATNGSFASSQTGARATINTSTSQSIVGNPVPSLSSSSGTGGTATSVVPSTTAVTRTNVWSESEGEIIESNMCFSLAEGRVTSMCTTRDGAYVIAGFSNGNIRLFDMTSTGHGDAQDRFGFQIGRIDGSNMQGSLQLHLELAEEVVSDPTTLGVCHLFAGVVQGSTKMLVADIRSLRALKRRRGFLSSDFHWFLKENTKLRGFMSLHSVSVTSNSASSASGDSDGFCGYTTKYRMLCGKGYGMFSVWDVTLSAYVTSSGELEYSDSWNVIATGNSTSTSLRFSCFVAQPLSEAVADLKLWGGSSADALVASQDTFRGENILSCFDDVDEGSNMSNAGMMTDLQPRRSRAGSFDRPAQPTAHDFEILFLPLAKDFRTCLISYDNKIAEGSTVPVVAIAKAQKSKTVGGCGKIPSFPDIHCASKDGTILFGGTDEFVVCKYLPSINDGESTVPGTGSVVAYESFSLAFVANESHSEATSTKRHRHLRSVESVTCTQDGSYAVILCSDNCVLLYSVCDVFGKGMRPSERHCSSLVPLSSYDDGEDGTYFASSQSSRHQHMHQQNLRNRSSGFLTILFQTTDLIKSELSINYTENSASNTAMCSCCVNPDVHDDQDGQQAMRPHKNPSNVVISIAFWLVSSPALGGVLKCGRLTRGTAAAASGTTRWTCSSLAPPSVIVPGVGVNRCSATPTTGRDRGSHGSSHTRPCICGDEYELHWPASDLLPWSPALALEGGQIAPSLSSKRRRDLSADSPTDPSAAPSPVPFNSTTASQPVQPVGDHSEDAEGPVGFRVSDALEALRAAAAANHDALLADKNKTKRAKPTAPEPKKATGKPKEATAPKVTFTATTKGADNAGPGFDDDAADTFYDDYEYVAPTEPAVQSAEAIRKIAELEQSLQESKNEIAMILRKADRRFEIERKFRRDVNEERQAMEAERASMSAERCRFNEQISILSAARRAALDRVDTVMNSLRTVYQPLTQVLQLASDLGALPPSHDATTASALRRGLDGISTAPSRAPSQLPTPVQAPIAGGSDGFYAADDRDEVMINHLVGVDNGHSNSMLPFTNPNRGATSRQPSQNAYVGSESDAHAADASSPVPEDAKERVLRLSTSPSKNLIMAPFCVACQAHTANVAFINCGHVCLCVEHCDQMPEQDEMRRCPLCSKNSRVCKLTGLSRN